MTGLAITIYVTEPRFAGAPLRDSGRTDTDTSDSVSGKLCNPTFAHLDLVCARDEAVHWMPSPF